MKNVVLNGTEILSEKENKLMMIPLEHEGTIEFTAVNFDALARMIGDTEGYVEFSPDLVDVAKIRIGSNILLDGKIMGIVTRRSLKNNRVYYKVNSFENV